MPAAALSERDQQKVVAVMLSYFNAEKRVRNGCRRRTSMIWNLKELRRRLHILKRYRENIILCERLLRRIDKGRQN